MPPADTPHGQFTTYFDIGTQTASPPLSQFQQQSSRRLESSACTCICSCHSTSPPPPLTSSVAPTIPRKEPKPKPLSDQSSLGRQPPRFNRPPNRVVSLPEAVEEAALGGRPFIQPRVASMPGAFPPLFPDDIEDETGLDAIPLQALSETAFSMQHDPRDLGFPQTPPPPAIHCSGSGPLSDHRPLFGERAPQSQDWVAWASSPPKPIPALHGPLSLPYARCPSGAEGTLIESDDRVSNVIWGLDNIPSRAQPQPDDSPLTEESPALSEFSPSFEADPLFNAAFRLAQRMEGLSVATPGTPLLSPVENSLYLSGLGLDFQAKRHPEMDALGHGRRPSLPASHPHARGSRRVVSTGSLTFGTEDRLKPPPAHSPLLTPPRSALPRRTPNMAGTLQLPYGLQIQPDSAQTPTPYRSTADRANNRSSLPVASLDLYPHAQDWQTRPNSNVPLSLQRDYSFGSDITIPGPGSDLHDYPSRAHTPLGHGRPVVSAREASTVQRPNQDTPRANNRACLGVNDASIQGRTLRRRLPVLEEDASFSASPKRNVRPTRTQASNIQLARPSSVSDTVSRIDMGDQLFMFNPPSHTGSRPTMGPSAGRGSTTASRTVKSVTYTAPHKRAKQKREA